MLRKFKKKIVDGSLDYKPKPQTFKHTDNQSVSYITSLIPKSKDAMASKIILY